MKSRVYKRAINFRVSEPEQLALGMIARQEAISLSEAARLAVREAAQKRGFKLPLGFLKAQSEGGYDEETRAH